MFIFKVKTFDDKSGIMEDSSYHHKNSSSLKTIGGSGYASIANKSNESNKSLQPRLKKSLSECEYFKKETNFTLPKTEKRFNNDNFYKYHHCARQNIMNNRNDSEISYIDIAKNKYSTSKSQYLLEQQQKLKEYKIDSAYPTNNNSDNYSSESSTENRGILKKNVEIFSSNGVICNNINNSSNKNNMTANSLKRNKGLSTLSLCSCDADTEVS
jgi:hypothetical protein